ncbi:MAG: DUF4129 domain-containing protein [Myxococcota bacterium]
MRTSGAIAFLLLLALATPVIAQVPGGDPGSDYDPEDELPPDLGGPEGAPALPTEEEEDPEEVPATPPAVDPTDALKKTTDAQREELKKSVYQFCNDDDFEPRVLYGDRHFCGTWEASETSACAHALHVCEIKKPWFSMPELPPVVGWILIGILVAGLLYLFGRALAGAGWGRKTELDLGEALDDAMAGELQALPEAPAMVILRKAKDTLDEGRAAEAAVLAQLAALRYFDDGGIVPFHPSRTNGEYLRALRSRRDLYEIYRAIAAETDRVRFGDGQVEVASLARAIEDGLIAFARAPVRSESVAPAALGVLALALSAGLLQGCERPGKPYYNHRPTGMAALPALLRGVGLEVDILRLPLDQIPEKTSVVVLHGAGLGKLSSVKLELLLDKDLAVVIIDDDLNRTAPHFLPVTATVATTATHAPTLDETGDVRGETQPLGPDGFCGVDLPSIDFELGSHLVKLPQGPRLAWNGLSATSSATTHRLDLYPILGLGPERASAVTATMFGAARLDEDDEFLPGCVFVLAAPDLFTNASLAIEGNAKFVTAFFSSLTRKDEKVLLIDATSGSQKSLGMGHTVADSKMLPAVIQGALFTLMLFLFLGAAFGPLRDPVKFEHKSFSEHIDALGRHYAARGPQGMAHAARALAKLVVLRHRKDLRGTGKDAGWQQLAGHLSEQYGLDEAQVGAALRLGLDSGESSTSTAPAGDAAGSASLLPTLSALLSGRQKTKKTKG